ncbi:MAG: family 16 glycosylhydrolase [Granulosicoccus sp.]|nr:family 16 glycosylhydrolase [Granulosicoccus sp.]
MHKLILPLLIFFSCITASHADGEKPSSVDNLNAIGQGNGSIALSWSRPNDNVGVIGYNLYRDGNYFTTLFDSTSYVDTGLSNGKQYSYYVVAFDKARNYSGKSERASASTGSGDSSSGGSPTQESAPGDGRPGAPQGLSAQAISGSEIRLSWQQPSGYVTGYNLYRNGSYFVTVKGSTSYVDNEVSSGNDYVYYVIAFGDGEYSGKSERVSANTGGSESSPPPPESQPANDEPSSSTVPSGYQLVFSDEFDGGSIDSGKWSTRYRWGPNLTINNEKQYYVDIQQNPDFGHSPFYVGGGKLQISASRTPDHLRGQANSQPYLSGAMTTFGKFTMKYGYLEMRAKMPRGKGLWPAFWLLHNDSNGIKPEIDIMEMLGDNPQVVYQTYHYYENYSLRSTPSFQAPGSDYSSNYHVFGMRWEPGKIVWYVDGRETNRYESGNVSSERMYILVNLALGGSWAGSPDGSTSFPATYSIDYIRAYEAQ